MSSRIWGPEGPPDEAYSRVTDPDRYRGLHAAADSVIADLVDRYEVAVTPVAVEGRWRGGVVRANELRPASAGASLVVIVTGFGVVLRAGHAFERALPSCGCDACDEDADELAPDLMETAEAIAKGGPTETRRRRRFGKDPFVIRLDDHSGWGESSGTIEPGDEHDAIPVGSTAWAPWPERSTPR